ncbi:MAG TPA: alpha/beta fold hydrolase, partial [Burkholderiales bacterium]|nr:alpha/beta fold hydrolase [Burkholderiales bacterium]
MRAGEGAPPFFFVHGFACAHEDWRSQIEHFSKTRSVLACDLPGHGRTGGAAGECTIERYGADVAELLQTLDAPAVLVGHSMGCRVVLEANRLAPRKVAAIALIDGSRMAWGEPRQADEAMRAAIEFTGFAAFAEALFRQMFFAPSAQAASIIERAKRLPAEVGAALFPALARWDAGQMVAALSAVRVPLLAIQSTSMSPERKRSSMRAGQTSPWLDLLRERVPGVRIEILPGLG